MVNLREEHSTSSLVSIMRILYSLIFFSFAASAQVRPYQTARLKSTGGAGVASILVTEGAVLNPAGLAFFNEAFASYQKSTTTLNNKSEERSADGRKFSKSNYSEGYFVFDNSSSIKGGMGYHQQKENGYTRERISGAGAIHVLENLSLGAIIQHTEDTRPGWYNSDRHNTTNPVVLGLTWLPLESLGVGAIYEDVGKALKDESRAVAGIQYSITSDLIVLVDAGGNPRGDFLEESILRVAAQYRTFQDFFVRVGQYKDNTINEEGIGYGVSWIGPKLGADLSMKTGRQIDREKGYIYPNEKLADLSFAFNMRF